LGDAVGAVGKHARARDDGRRARGRPRPGGARIARGGRRRVSIGIVGAGTAGLHLALYLQQHGVDAVLYAERPADEVAAGRLPNTVAHHAHTRARERELGVAHWDETGPSYDRHYHFFGGEHPLEFPGDFAAPSLAVDYRLYLPKLLADYEHRGGRVVYGA